MMKRKIVVVLIIIVVVLLSMELIARYGFGFGDPPIYVESDSYEYIYAPDQNVSRFGNLIKTNEFSMRSEPLEEKDDLRILFIGDSVANGEHQIDHSDLASTILEEKLNKEFDEKIRVLNISAASWGPDNAMEYIKTHGDFGAKAIVIVFSSHDADDLMTKERSVGVNPLLPGKKPFCALQDILCRYIIPMSAGLLSGGRDKEPSPQVAQRDINPGWKFFVDHCKKKNIRLIAVLHPDLTEIREGSYNADGERILRFFWENEVEFIPELMNGVSFSMYSDEIHYNEKGQKFLAGELYRVLSMITIEETTETKEQIFLRFIKEKIMSKI